MAAEPLRIDDVLRVDRVTTIGEATENMIHQLRGRPADLVELVEAIRWRPLHVVAIPAEAILHWRSEEPRSWKLVLEWLTIMGVEVNLS
jgi:hypothetical protein